MLDTAGGAGEGELQRPFPRGKANLWGDEIYFSTTIKAPAENTKEVVEMGDVAYWPPGNAVCLFFGLTPVSRAGEIRPASPVNVIGRVEKDFKKLKSVKQGEEIVIKKAG